MTAGIISMLDRHFAKYDGPFEWGVRDCVTFAAEWVLSATGRELVPEGMKWASEAGANAAMDSLGATDVKALADKFLEPRAMVFVGAGDIVARNMPRLGWTLGICTGQDARFVELRCGLISYPLSRCGAAWRVI